MKNIEAKFHACLDNKLVLIVVASRESLPIPVKELIIQKVNEHDLASRLPVSNSKVISFIITLLCGNKLIRSYKHTSHTILSVRSGILQLNPQVPVCFITRASYCNKSWSSGHGTI